MAIKILDQSVRMTIREIDSKYEGVWIAARQSSEDFRNGMFTVIAVGDGSADDFDELAILPEKLLIDDCTIRKGVRNRGSEELHISYN